jgi:photosystem II stability/assembly factor-like uncharacterized protein
VTDTALRTSSVGTVAVSESNPDIVYIGTGETELRGDIIQGDGLYKSTDGGKTWAPSGLAETQAIGRIRIHPTNPDIVYVAALGHPFGPNPERGVFRTTDGGKTWKHVLSRGDRAGAVDLGFDPKNPQVLFAAMWEVFRTPYSLSSGGPGSGLFKTSNGGDSWDEITRNPGLPKGIVGKTGVSVSGADSNRVWAIVEAEDGGLFRSDDGGATWTKVNDERRFRQRAFYYTRVYADPKNRDRVYVLNTGFYRSDDGGKTFRTIRVPHGDNHDLWIASSDPQRMINGNDGGANVSMNGGDTWTAQRYPTAQIYHVVTTAHIPYHVCGAQQDNSTACVPGNGNGDEFYQVGGGESGYIAADPRNPGVFYAGSYGGLLTRYDRATGQMREINVWPENPMGHSSKDIRERFQWTYPIVFAPTDPRVLYVGSQHVWKTTNEGQSWERISGDLPRADPKTMGPSGGPITLDQTGVETYATVFTIAPSPKDPNTIWAGSDDGVVSITRDGGRTPWQRVTPPDLPDLARISLIEASPHKPGTAYVAANRYQQDDWSPYFYRTDDYGRTWTKIVNGIGSRDFARAIREDPARPGLLFAGTEHTVYVSFDDGANWQSLRLDLPVTPVHDITIKDSDVIIATHGRSFYVLDNIGVLRQLTPAVATSSVYLFRPADAMRSVSRGVTIDYYLKQPADKVTIDILDAQGNLVRAFTGTPDTGKPGPSRPGETPAGGEEEEGPRAPAPRVATRPGMNRFTWDMRYPDATGFPKMILWAGNLRGPVPVPGTYQARLSVSAVGGASTPGAAVPPTSVGAGASAPVQTLTQSFVITKNPNLTNVTDADLQEQFKLAMHIRDRLSQANETVVKIRALKEQINDRLGKLEAAAGQGKTSVGQRFSAADKKIMAAGEALVAKLTDIEGEIYQYRNQSSQDPLNYPIKLNNKLAALLGVVESADARPTAQSYDVFKDLSARLDAQIARLDGVLKTDVPALNKLLASRKLEPITIP